jgi:diamine N-acetyltransferase
MVRLAQDLRFRDGAPEDAEALSRLAQDTFEETFGGLYRLEDLQRHLEDTFGLDAIRQKLEDPDVDVRIAEAGRRMIGYAIIGPVRLPYTPDHQPALELYRLYIRASDQGVGVGRILFNWVLTRARERASAELCLGVWEHNERAIAMYESRGFETVGQHTYRVGRHEDIDLIMRKVL